MAEAGIPAQSEVGTGGAGAAPAAATIGWPVCAGLRDDAGHSLSTA